MGNEIKTARKMSQCNEWPLGLDLRPSTAIPIDCVTNILAWKHQEIQEETGNVWDSDVDMRRLTYRKFTWIFMKSRMHLLYKINSKYLNYLNILLEENSVIISIY